MAGSLLQVEGVETYYGNIRALNGVSVTVEEGEIVALIGAPARAPAGSSSPAPTSPACPRTRSPACASPSRRKDGASSRA
jgi:branched-chain amino acid transport system ATP-binding protein